MRQEGIDTSTGIATSVTSTGTRSRAAQVSAKFPGRNKCGSTRSQERGLSCENDGTSCVGISGLRANFSSHLPGQLEAPPFSLQLFRSFSKENCSTVLNSKELRGSSLLRPPLYLEHIALSVCQDCASLYRPLNVSAPRSMQHELHDTSTSQVVTVLRHATVIGAPVDPGIRASRGQDERVDDDGCRGREQHDSRAAPGHEPEGLSVLEDTLATQVEAESRVHWDGGPCKENRGTTRSNGLYKRTSVRIIGTGFQEMFRREVYTNLSSVFRLGSVQQTPSPWLTSSWIREAVCSAQ